MIKKSAAALVAAGALIAVAPSLSVAGGEIQEYERTSRTTSYQAAPQQYSNYAPAPSYARPMGAYMGQPMSPCGSMPYGYGGGGYACGSPCGGGGYGGGGGLFGNPVFSAGILGLGLGYLIWH